MVEETGPFYEGREFGTYHEVDDVLKEYQEQNVCLFITDKSELLHGDPTFTHKYMKLVCKNYGEERLNPN